jgi:N-acetylmuramoyl-L-alanine amidase
MHKIAIACGHTLGGADTGARKYLIEENCTREILTLVDEGLKELGYETVVCRIDKANSVMESLAYRVNKANNSKADFYAEFHLNSGGGHGVETYVCATGGKAEMYAQKVQQEMCKIGYTDRGIKTANFYVIENTTMSAILIECGFVDSKEDTSLYNPQKIANAFIKAITGQEPKQKFYKVQLGAFKDRTNCEQYADKVKKEGYQTYIVAVDGFYKVQVGAFREKNYAEQLLTELKTKGHTGFIV